MPKKGVVPPQLRPYLFTKGGGRRGATSKRSGFGGYARRGASWLKGGGIVAAAGTAMGAVYGAKPALEAILAPGAYTPTQRAKQAMYEFTGVGIGANGGIDSLDIDHGIGNVVAVAGGAIGGRVLGRIGEKVLDFFGVNVDDMMR